MTRLRRGVNLAARPARGTRRGDETVRQARTGGEAWSGSDLLSLQRMVGNQAVSALVAGQRIQREAAGAGVGVRDTAVFPASLRVLGALASLGQTSVGGSAVAASLSSSGTVDVGGNVSMGPLAAQRIVAPIVVLRGVKVKGGSPSTQDRAGSSTGDSDVDRTFDSDEQSAPATLARFSEGDAAQAPPASAGGFRVGEAAQAVGGASAADAEAPAGLSEGDAAQPTGQATRDDQTGQDDGSFSALVVRESLAVGGNMAVGLARLGANTAIGGALNVPGPSKVNTLQAGGTLIITGGQMDPNTSIEASVIQNDS